MARHVPSRFIEKIHEVQAVLDSCSQATAGNPLEYDAEIAPGVRLVRARVGDQSLVLSLWTDPRDIAEICGDGGFPATAGALVVHSTVASGSQLSSSSSRRRQVSKATCASWPRLPTNSGATAVS